jgi:hypothetical protein
VLYQNDWEYHKPRHTDKVFAMCLEELLSWYARKKTKISHVVADTIAESIASKEGLSPLFLPTLTKAVQRFIFSKTYKGLENPLFGYDAKLQVGKNFLTYSVPFISDGDDTVIIISDPFLNERELLKMSYEVQFISLWAFYARSRYPEVVNIFVEDNELKEVRYKPTEKNIKSAKLNLNNLVKVPYDYICTPPAEVCKGCSRRKECPVIQKLRES